MFYDMFYTSCEYNPHNVMNFGIIQAPFPAYIDVYRTT